MVAIHRPPAELALPRPHRMKLGKAHTGAAHLLEQRWLAFPELRHAEGAEGVVDAVNLHALECLLAQQVRERAPRVVVGKDVDLEADTSLGVVDHFVGGAKGLAVFVELSASAVGEADGLWDDPAVAVAAGAHVYAGGGADVALREAVFVAAMGRHLARTESFGLGRIDSRHVWIIGHAKESHSLRLRRITEVRRGRCRRAAWR